MYDKFTKLFFKSHTFLRISALVLAILLFVYVNGEKLQNVRDSDSGNSSTLTSTVKKTITVPLNVNVNSDKYVVTGYPANVKVTITGPAALVTTTSNTQNFKIAADLSKLGTGTHKVKLKETGINKDLSYAIDPSTITVTIATRKTVTLPVDIQVNSDQLPDSYKVGKATSSIDSVKVTGASADISKINRIIASVTIPKNTKSDLSRKVTLQAIDSNGNTVNVVISPSTTTVKVPISHDSNGSSSESKTSSASSTSQAISESDDSESSTDSSSSSSESSN